MKRNDDNVKFIYFDLGDTLVHINPQLQVDTVKRIAYARGQALINKHQIDQAIISYKAACEAEWETRSTDILKVRTEADEREYWPGFVRSVLQRLGVASPEAELVELLAKRSADPQSFTRFNDTLLILKRLKNCYGFELGIISNAFPSAEKILDELELTPLFKHRILSHELPFVKPLSQIYKHAAKQAGLPRNQIMFVDDRLEFVRGAASVGMKVVLFDRLDQYAPSEWNGPTIRHLSKLPELIKPMPEHVRNTRSSNLEQADGFLRRLHESHRRALGSILVLITTIVRNFVGSRQTT